VDKYFKIFLKKGLTLFCINDTMYLEGQGNELWKFKKKFKIFLKKAWQKH